MPFEHPSGLPDAYLRALDHPEWQALVAQGRFFLHPEDFNDASEIVDRRHRNLGSLVTRDGSRIIGADAVMDVPNGQIILSAGELWVLGDRIPVPAATLAIPVVGLVQVGVLVTTSYVTDDDDASLVGLVPGSLAEGEPALARKVISVAWALAPDDYVSRFLPVYAVQDGTIVDQTPPPSLTGINAAIGVYDRDAHGSYIVSGHRVTALGKTGTSQFFSIEEGVANINGAKKTRYAALRFGVAEDFSTETVDGEPHTYPGGATAAIAVNHTPIESVVSALVTKEVTDTVTRGGVTNGADILAHNSVTSVIEVKQGATTYVLTTDYLVMGDQIVWSPGGAEPAPGSSYTVKYRYLDNVVPSLVTDTQITVGGGVTGTAVIFSYRFKLPRNDLICLTENGDPFVVKGVAARENPLDPVEPVGLLALAKIENNWSTKPAVTNLGTRSVPYKEMWKYLNKLVDALRLIALERLQSALNAREPILKLGTFVDPFNDDTYRDAGYTPTQTAASGEGVLRLAIDPTFYTAPLTAPVMLDYTEEVIIRQESATACIKINPYQNYDPLPGSLSLTPAADFWTEQQTIWTSPQTLEFDRGVATQARTDTTVTTDVVDQRSEQAEFLRQISVAFVIKGFGAGEILSTLTFDGINVKPPGTQTANGAGEISGSFTIPPNVPAGSKLVLAVGAGLTEAGATFVGAGTINIDVMRQTTTIERWRAMPATQNQVSPETNPNRGPSNTGGNHDPVAQTFNTNEMRQVVGFDFRLCNIGNPNKALLVDQVTVETGFPTEEIIAEAYIPMVGATVGWKSARFDRPVLTPGDRPHAIVIKTDDADHSVSIARLGDFDADTQSYVGAQPYTTGVLLTSANAQTWTAEQTADLTMRVVAAKFAPLSKVVPLGSHALVNCSDFQVRAAVELPTAGCSVVFEVERANGDIYRVLPYQVVSLNEFITETVQLRAILTGIETISPTLYAPVTLVAGRIRTTGTYVTRAFKFGTAIEVTAYLETNLPAGSALAVHYDKSDNNWISMPEVSATQLQEAGWFERKFRVDPVTGVTGRIRLTLTGTPAARPLCASFSAGTF